MKSERILSKFDKSPTESFNFETNLKISMGILSNLRDFHRTPKIS